MEKFPEKLAKKLKDRESSGALRALRRQEVLVDFSSNDYLGYARNLGIASWATQILSGAGLVRNGAAGARLLSGNHELYCRLEEMLEQLHEDPVLVFNSGYDANIGFFSSVPQRNDLVFFDEFAHASIRDGIRMGLAKSYKFRHNDLQDLESQLNRLVNDIKPPENEVRECYVVTESVFSMDGDSPDLPALVNSCEKYGCRLVIDEAHAVGVFSPGGIGLMQEMGLHKHTFARILTFGKAMGVHGAAIAGNNLLKEYLLNFARSFIYSTALPPHTIATLLAAYHFSATDSGKEKQQKLQENIDSFRNGLVSLGLTQYFIPGKSAIQSCLLSGNARVRKVAEALRKAGFDLRPILAPTVPDGMERLRFCLHSYNTHQQIEDVLVALAALIKKL